MDSEIVKSVVQGLRDVGVVFDDGLSDSEISQIQQLYGIQFPPDLRELLQIALPIEWARTDTEAKLLFLASILHEAPERPLSPL